MSYGLIVIEGGAQQWSIIKESHCFHPFPEPGSCVWSENIPHHPLYKASIIYRHTRSTKPSFCPPTNLTLNRKAPISVRAVEPFLKHCNCERGEMIKECRWKPANSLWSGCRTSLSISGISFPSVAKPHLSKVTPWWQSCPLCRAPQLPSRQLLPIPAQLCFQNSWSWNWLGWHFVPSSCFPCLQLYPLYPVCWPWTCCK